MSKKVFTGSIAILLLSIFLLISGCDDFSLVDVLTRDIFLVPAEITLNLDETIKFEVSSGIAPYEFTEVGNGEVPEGIYTAPSTTGNFIISVRDDRDRIAEAYVTVVEAISITPEVVSTGIGGVLEFRISGGVIPYISVIPTSGLGSVSALTYNVGPPEGYLFYYEALSLGIDQILVTDSNNQIAEVIVTIVDNSNLMIIPDVAEVLAGEVFSFSASGGTPITAPAAPYIFSLVDAPIGAENINPDNGRYTAPAAPFTGIRNVSVEDSVGATAEAIVYIVNELLSINPSLTLTLYVGDEFTFSASYGTPPYIFSILSGDEAAGSIDSVTGEFIALAKDPSVTVIVTDANGNTSTSRVKIKN